MNKELLIPSVAMALFIICPRMAGMLNVVARDAGVSLALMATVASVLAIPLVLLMVWIYARVGIWGRWAFAS